jgi:flagellar motor switch protein FliN/FliY
VSEETSSEDVELTDFAQQEKPPSPPPEEAPAKKPASGDETRTAADLEAVFDVPVRIAAVLGRTQMEVSDLLKLSEGDVVEIDRKVGEAIDIFVNNRLVARGEVVLVEDRLGVTMTEIIKGENN